MAAVGTTPITSPMLATNANVGHANNHQISSQLSSNINPMAIVPNGASTVQSNTGCEGIPAIHYPSVPQENQTKYLVGAHNVLPHLFQEQSHTRQPHQQLAHLSTSQQISQQLPVHHQHLLSLPYQTNNLVAASTLASTFHPLFATSSLPRSTTNYSNLSNFSTQHHSTKNVQQLVATVHAAAAASGQQQLQQNIQNYSRHSTTGSNSHHHGHQMHDHFPSSHPIQQVPTQTIIQPSESRFYNPFLPSSSILPATSMITKAPLLRTPIIGKVRPKISYLLNQFKVT